MADKLIQSYFKSYLTRTALSLLLTAGAFLLFGCLCVGIALIPERLLDPDAKGILLALSIPCYGIIFTVGLVIWVLLNNQQVYAQFDRAFTPLGLTRSRYLIAGLQYKGTYRGRQVNVYYYVAGRRYFRTPDLQIYLNGNIRTRLGIGTQNALATLVGSLMQKQPFDPGDPAYAGLLFYPQDESWSRQLLGDSQVRGAIVRLAGKDIAGVRALNFSPESLRLQLRHFSLAVITPETVREWMDDLFTLTETAEGLPPPEQIAEASDWERAGRSDRGRFLLPMVIISISLFIVGLIFMVGCSLLIVFFEILSGGFS